MRKLFIVLALLGIVMLHAENWGPWHVNIDPKVTPSQAQELSQGKHSFANWKTLDLKQYACDLDTVAGTKMPLNATAVIACKVMSETDKKVLVGVGADWWHACYVNGEACHATGKDGNITTKINPLNFVFPISLKAGENTVVFHLTRGKATWMFAFTRIIDSDLLPKNGERAKTQFLEKLCGKAELTCDAPYVVRMSTTSASVGIEFSLPIAAGIRFKNAATGTERTQWTTANGLRTLATIHRFDLAELEPATTYSYEILTLDEKTAKEIVQTTGTFKTYPASGISQTFYAVSDNQVGGPARTNYLNMMFKNCGLGKADFIVSLGDMDSHFGDFRYIYFKTFFAVLKANGYPMQAELLRGNHEYRGPQTDLYNQFFGRGYDAFKYGDVFYIVLDCGEDKNVIATSNHYTLRNDLDGYFKEQAAWFETVINSDECKNAKARIVLAHTVPFSFENGFFYKNINSVVGKYLFGPKPLCKIDLWLCGDIHSPYRYDPVAKKFTGGKRKFNDKKLKAIKEFDGSITFPVFVNDGPGGAGIDITTTKVQITDDAIRVTNLSPDGVTQDDFTIRRGKPFEVHSTKFVDWITR